MELSKEVHALLERIKKLSQQAQKNETYSESLYNSSHIAAHKNTDLPRNTPEEIMFSYDDLIPVDNMDFSDTERWLHVSENSLVNPYLGDLIEWLRQDFSKTSDSSLSSDFEQERDTRKFIDTRTFTRPKKRISRPTLDQLTDSYFSPYNSRSPASDTYYHNTDKHNPRFPQTDSFHNMSSDDTSIQSTPTRGAAVPLHFKLSEPVYNSSFDRILASATDSIDSFQNMSPPSLMNSLCSSTFTTLMDSGYVNQDNVPNENSDATFVCNNESVVLNENDNPNITYTPVEQKGKFEDKCNRTRKETPLNDTYDMKIQNDTNEQLNSTYSMPADVDLKNMTNKNNDIGYYNLSGTFTKKTKPGSLSNSLKASCPDINRTFQKSHDFSLDLTFQKLSDSQPNLTEDLKRTILNQSMELMHPSIETYHSARSGSADSLDERSSSISDSSKESGTKILNMGDLDNLAKVQEQSLHQAVSTPKVSKNRLVLLDGDVLSPIQNCSADEEYLSDSDMSDTCVTARSRFSKHNSPLRNAHPVSVPVSLQRNTERVARPAGNITRPLPSKSEMIVKPMEVNRTVHLSGTQSAQIPATTIRPKMRSGLPRPTGLSTGIPRPTSRIPGPKTLRPPSSRPSVRQPPKADWMDGCY